MVRALAFHQCGPGSNPGVHTICGLSLLLVLSLAPRGFFSGYSGFPRSLKTNTPQFIWNARTQFNEILRTPKCSVGKQITKFTILVVGMSKRVVAPTLLQLSSLVVTPKGVKSSHVTLVCRSKKKIISLDICMRCILQYRQASLTETHRNTSAILCNGLLITNKIFVFSRSSTPALFYNWNFRIRNTTEQQRIVFQAFKTRGKELKYMYPLLNNDN